MSEGVLADSLLLFSLILIKNGHKCDVKKEGGHSLLFLTFGHHTHVYLDSVLMGKDPLKPSAL